MLNLRKFRLATALLSALGCSQFLLCVSAGIEDLSLLDALEAAEPNEEEEMIMTTDSVIPQPPASLSVPEPDYTDVPPLATLLCKGHPDGEGNCPCYANQSARKLFRDAETYLNSGKMPISLIFSLQDILMEFSGLANEDAWDTHGCAGAALSALFLKIEDTMYLLPTDARGMWANLNGYLRESMARNRLSEYDVSLWRIAPQGIRNGRARRILNVLYPDGDDGFGNREGMETALDSPKEVFQPPSSPPSVDLVLSFCREDLTWLRDILAAPGFLENPDSEKKLGRMRIFLYRKCLRRTITPENELLIREIDELVSGVTEEESEPVSENSEELLTSDQLADVYAAEVHLAPNVKKSNNRWNGNIALENNGNLDITEGKDSEETVLEAKPIRWRKTFLPSQDAVNDGEPLTEGLPTSGYRYGSAFYLIDVEDDIRADECSAYATHLSIYGDNAAGFTYFLHADADHHIYPTTEIVSRMLRAGWVVGGWKVEGKTPLNDFGGDEISGVPPRSVIWRSLEREFSVTYTNRLSGDLFPKLRVDGDNCTEAEDPHQHRPGALIASSINQDDHVESPNFISLASSFVNFQDSERLLDLGSWNHFYKFIFGSSIEPNTNGLRYYCCAHFVVKKEGILKRPISFYRRLRSYLVHHVSYTDLTGLPVGAGKGKEAVEVKHKSLYTGQHLSALHAVPPRTTRNPEKPARIYPLTTWYDITCRYPCQNLMNFWHVVFGEELTQEKRYLDSRLPFFIQSKSTDNRAYSEYMWRKDMGVD